MQYDTNVPGFTIDIDGKKHIFQQQPFAPPSGQSAKNYYRYIHNKSNGTKYMILWITNRKHTKEESCGGNFFFADYGIRVQMTSDTSIGWQPKQVHGTSLMEKGEGFEQVGLSIGISKRCVHR
ncbi:hypothetical protein EV426DRAFT_529857 [Tirmania nivea]|nr:hypothetical protein EV426DRAFT_529857 [Tirmania nivea]